MDLTPFLADCLVLLPKAAAAYARAGFHILPLVPREKKPCIKGGWHAATDDLEQIKAWWQEWPEANIGLTPGYTGIVVLDIDGPERVNAIARAYDSELTWDLNTPIIKTPGRGGGYHFYFRLPPGLELGQGRFTLHGVEIEYVSLKKYMVVPPSIHPEGRCYRAIHSFWEIAMLPDRLAHLLGTRRRSGITPVEQKLDDDQAIKKLAEHNSTTSERNKAWVLGLAAELRSMIEGNRHNWTLRKLFPIFKSTQLNLVWADQQMWMAWEETQQRTGDNRSSYTEEYEGMRRWVVNVIEQEDGFGAYDLDY